MNGARRIEAHLAAWLEQHSNARLLGEQVAHGGMAGTTGSLASAHPDRVVATPIGAASALGLATGIAYAGAPVVVELVCVDDLLEAVPALRHLRALADTEFSPDLVVRCPIQQSVNEEWSVILNAGVETHVATSASLDAVFSKVLAGGLHIVLEASDLYEEHEVRATPPVEHAHVVLAAAGNDLALAHQAAAETDAGRVDVVELTSLCPLPDDFHDRVRAAGRLVVMGPEGLQQHVHAATLRTNFLYLESPMMGCLASLSASTATLRDSVHY